ncbi:MAG: M23 family metallopeptidase [Tannerella sp.]|jgi:murein DD-endopeptidase MepM/ murein hydrolase activator NlpD|nr:M23 family metallopeptidase [Tannerella sp.]
MGILGSRKTYYRYNDKTLEYERVYLSAKERVAVVLRNLSLGLLIGFIAFFAFIRFFNSPMETLLRKENRLLQTQYDMLLKELGQANDVLEDMQQRDEHLYRAIFHADSIPMSIRKSGFGGSNRYEHLNGLPNSDLIIETTQKMDILKKQLYIQSNSLEELISLGKDLEHKIRCVPAIQPVANKDLKRTASGYGMRIDPIYHIPKFHAGMDFSAALGTEIYATGNGVVIYASWRQGYGNCVIIDHGYDYKTLYGHIDKYKVRVGQKVSRGEVIATVGDTGKSTAPHLHYEVMYKGRHDNPTKYYFQDLTPEEYDRMLQIADNHGQVMD